ncbi:MAG: hypothetical protein AAGF84_14715 [Planctomycetota bacterium]
MKQGSHPANSKPGDSAFAVSFDLHAAPEAKIARALASLPMFAGWSHQPTTREIESLVMDLDEQELMTTAAVCLLRLAKCQHQTSGMTPENDAA